jgi:beta-N-acetylhexosaminidase
MDVVSTRSGLCFIISFPEDIPGDATLYFIQDNHIGGIILFTDQCRDADSLKSWLTDFKKTLGRPLMVAVDQEGGRVCRFTGNFPRLESPRYYGNRGDLSEYRSDLARVCERLYEIGININLVPTVDLLDTKAGHVLDTRTFSDDPEVAGRFARATLDVHRQQGLLTCAKHFPGLGRSEGDPHLVPAVAELSEDDFNRVELPPFKNIIDYGVDAVMVTHLTIPKVDESPAIVSKKIIDGWLKKKLEFPGAVITDDLLMEAALEINPIENLVVDSFEAGNDLLLFGQNLKQTQKAFEAFSEAWEGNRFDKSRMTDAIKRVDTIRKKVVS